MFNARKYKQQQVEAWNGVAATYHLGFAGMALPAIHKMLDGARLQPGFQVLELACATGSDSFLAAEQVGADGRVVGIDLAPGMIEVANDKKAQRGASNVEFEVMDAEKLSFRRESFDAVFCKWSLEQFTDAHRAMKEAYRVLKPGGVFSSMVVGRAERSKFLSLGPLEMFRIDPGLITAEDGAPSTFDLGGDGALAAAYNAAGFVNVQARPVTLMFTCADGETYWDLIWNTNGFMRRKLELADPGVREMARRATMATADSYCGADGIRLPLEVVLATGERPKKGRRSVPTPERVKTLDELAAAQSSVRGIGVARARQMIDSAKTVVIDLRPWDEHAVGHIPGAAHLTRSELELRVGQLVDPAKTEHIVVYSSTGRSSRLAAATLIDMGYQGVVSLDGGFQAWRDQQAPIATR